MKIKFKQILALFLCIVIILPSLANVIPFISQLFPTIVYADDYEKNDTDEDGGITYYIVEGEDVDDLFDFTIKDALSGQEAVDWLFSFRTYTVIGKTDDGQYHYYFNTPNLQSIAKNSVIKNIDDGYTDDTFNVNDDEWIVDVGKHGKTDSNEDFIVGWDEDNVIVKYGFKIPSYTYMGEYPKITMSTAGVVPKKWYQKLWRGIKAIFGASFFDAPDAKNFKTITYHNHGYKDKNRWMVEFFQEYYYKYWVNKIADQENFDQGYFKDAQAVVDETVTEDEMNAACDWMKQNHDNIVDATKCKLSYLAYFQAGTTSKPRQGDFTKTNVSMYTAIAEGNIPSVETSDIPLPTTVTNGGWMKGSKYHYMNSTVRYSMGFMQPMTCDADMFNEKAGKIPELTIAGGSGYIDTWNSFQTRYSGMITKAHGSTVPLSAGDNFIDWYNSQYLPMIDDMCNKAKIVYLEEIKETKTTGSGKNKKTTTTTKKVKKLGSSSEYDSIKADPKKTILGITYDNSVNGTIYSVASFINFMKSSSHPDSYTFSEQDFITAEQQSLLDTYNDKAYLVYKYEDFVTKMEMGDDEVKLLNSDNKIYYKQCMIQSKEEGKCESKKYGGNKTTISVAHLYAYSGLYKELGEDRFTKPGFNPKLTELEAQQIIKKIQSYCGPYYSEVISNMLVLMLTIAYSESDIEALSYFYNKVNDPRIMPYDVSTMTSADKSNYSVKDPRVELYKSHVIGGVVSDLSLSVFGFTIYIKPQKTLINLGGRITEIAVFFQQMCNFDVLDKWDLSPTSLWISSFVALLYAFIAFYFIFKTVAGIIKMGTRGGVKLIIGFLCFILELGTIAAIMSNPEKTWNKIKSIENRIINLGEIIGPEYNTTGLSYLYAGASDQQVSYYLPYLDMWSMYNTGYGILDEEQKIDKTRDAQELIDVNLPTINGNEIQHYSILLMDSFSYYGFSDSVSTSVIEDGKTLNGNTINNNAYRVVDHFMAPRVHLEDYGVILKLSTSENENYNGNFQSGIINLLVKLLNCLFAAFMSLVKFLTFIWQWWMFYIFIFKFILGKIGESKSTKDMLVEVFSPVLFIMIIGTYSSIAIWLGMQVNGLIGIMVMFFLFWLTFKMIMIWKKLRRGTMFPQTLKPLIIVLDAIETKRKKKRNKHVEGYGDDYDYDSEYKEKRNHNLLVEDLYTTAIKDYGWNDEDENGQSLREKLSDIETAARKFFNDNGTPKTGTINELHQKWFNMAYYYMCQNGGTKETAFGKMDPIVLNAYNYMLGNVNNAEGIAKTNIDSIKAGSFKKLKEKEAKEKNKESDDTTNTEVEFGKTKCPYCGKMIPNITITEHKRSCPMATKNTVKYCAICKTYIPKDKYEDHMKTHKK